MATSLPVKDLNIVGYANVLPASMLPSIVPPIFNLRNDPSRFFLPPYTFKAGCLCGAAEVLKPELIGLQRDREITLFPEILEAKSGYELFVDQEFQCQYMLRAEADAWLAAIAEKSVAEAETALRLGDLDKADRLAGVALSADDRKVTPLVLLGAVHRARGDQEGEHLMASLAKHAVSEAEFRRMVGYYDRHEVKYSGMKNMAVWPVAA